MSLRERWNELDTGMKVLVGLGAGFLAFVVLIPIVLVLSAVVASFVLGVGGEAAATPAASFSVGYDTVDGEQTVTITHNSGETIDADAVTVHVGDQRVSWNEDDGVIQAGDSFTHPVSPETHVSVVWSDGGEESVMISSESPPA